MTNAPLEPSQEGRPETAPPGPSPARAPSIENLAYTCAVDLAVEPADALAIARDLLRTVRKSGLRSPFAEALLRRLALAEWTKRDRPRPQRLDSKDPKESAILLFFYQSWGATYEDLGAALSVPADEARQIVHKARVDHVGLLVRLPLPRPECRRYRETFSSLREGQLDESQTEEVAQHIRGCRDCSNLDRHIRDLLATPARPLLEAPIELVGRAPGRPTLTLSLDAVSRTQRRAGIALLALGVFMAIVQFHPGLNASVSAQFDRLSASWTRLRGRGERLVEELRVLRALAVGTMEGRTEELSRTLDEYVNSEAATETSTEKNKPSPDAVLDSRDPQRQPQSPSGSPGTPGPTRGSPSPAVR